jgi:hypothetical protein
MQPGATRPQPLRFRLFLLAASGLVPLGAGAAVLHAPTSRSSAKPKRSAPALDLSRALAIAVDAELQSTIALLQNLAIATQLEAREPAELGGRRFARWRAGW